MKVILTEDIAKLGNCGDTVEVKAGYARNFLMPRNLAIPATRGNLRAIDDVWRSMPDLPHDFLPPLGDLYGASVRPDPQNSEVGASVRVSTPFPLERHSLSPLARAASELDHCQRVSEPP